MMTKTEIEAIRNRCFAEAENAMLLETAENLFRELADRDKPCECGRKTIDTSRLTRSRLFWDKGDWFIETIAGRFDADTLILGARYCCFCGHPLPEMEGVDDD